MNKMFKKIFAVVAACATVATMSVSAFAATANHEDGTVSVSGYEAVTGATQYTVMVFSVGADVTDLAKATPSKVDDIYYINQGTELYDEVNKDGLLDKMLVKATNGENALPAGNYAVRIGNDANEVVTLGLAVTADVTFMYGDVNGDGAVDLDDATEIINYVLWLESTLDDLLAQ